MHECILHALRFLPSPNSMYDFHFIVWSKAVISMTAARHDLAVHLQRHALAGQFQAVEQLSRAEGVGDIRRGAVELNLHVVPWVVLHGDFTAAGLGWREHGAHSPPVPAVFRLLKIG